jgi:hypothetical protein
MEFLLMQKIYRFTQFIKDVIVTLKHILKKKKKKKIKKKKKKKKKKINRTKN